jgi:hypothetical protein
MWLHAFDAASNAEVTGPFQTFSKGHAAALLQNRHCIRAQNKQRI